MVRASQVKSIWSGMTLGSWDWALVWACVQVAMSARDRRRAEPSEGIVTSSVGGTLKRR